jgi:uncharacterized protein (TIGR03084 family)
MDPIVVALAKQQAELALILERLRASDWRAPTRCEGWDVSDVVLHLAQSDEMAIASATGGWAGVAPERTAAWSRASSVDEGVAVMVERERGAPTADLLARWSTSADRLIDVLDAVDPSQRVTWVAGELSARTLATTRLAETWIHAGDVAEAVGAELEDTDRLRLVARLAWRTLPFAFASAGLELEGPVAFRLVAPDGGAWDFVPDETPVTTIRGSAVELCAIAARRCNPADTSLIGDGPDAENVLRLVRTYA